ncbi:MAG: ECF transporter S component [Clostridiales bacterium]|nr:ECF transporter S component [Clostridiales bacterium]
MKDKTKQICMIGLFMALICISTLFFKVPIPGGYAHLGNGFIFLAAVLLGNPGAIIAAGVGSALADLLGGWFMWIMPTLLIKLLMGFVVASIAPRRFNIKSIRTLIAVVIGTFEMVAGYFIAGIVLMESIGASATQIPGLIIEDVVGIIVFYFVGFALYKTKAWEKIK